MTQSRTRFNHDRLALVNGRIPLHWCAPARDTINRRSDVVVKIYDAQRTAAAVGQIGASPRETTRENVNNDLILETSRIVNG